MITTLKAPPERAGSHKQQVPLKDNAIVAGCTNWNPPSPPQQQQQQQEGAVTATASRSRNRWVFEVLQILPVAVLHRGHFRRALRQIQACSFHLKRVWPVADLKKKLAKKTNSRPMVFLYPFCKYPNSHGKS